MEAFKKFCPLYVNLAIFISILFSSIAGHAQGNVDGYVFGTVTSDAAAIEDATVSIRSVDTGVSRTIYTSADGTYRFSRLATGTYKVSVTAPDYHSTSQRVLVNIGQGTPANFNLLAGDIEEEIIVTAPNSNAIDVNLVETTTVFTASEIERLPIPRDINAVALMAPGAVLGDSAFGSSRVTTAGHYSTGFGLVSFGGASVAENVYYINGMNVTNFRNGLGGSTLPFEFYDQFQLKTGGYSAEFGRSTGGVVNAVTRRGTNKWNVRSGYIIEPESFRGHSPNVPDPEVEGELTSVFKYDKKDSRELFASLRGPIIRDSLFIYGIYQARGERVRNFTASGRFHREIDEDPFWGGKIDWIVNNRHTIEFTAFSDEKATIRTSFKWDEVSRAVGENLGDTFINRGGENYIGQYTGGLTRNFTMSLLAGKGTYDLSTRAQADDTCPLAFDSRGNGGLNQIGCWTNSFPESGFDERKVYRADFEYAFNNRHLLRFGVDNETNTSTNVRQYSGPRGDYFRYYDATPGETLSNGGVVPDGVTEIVRYRVFKGGGEFETITGSYYIEDEWVLTDTITLRLGLRNERFDNKNSDGDTFIKVTDQWAPRLGITWDWKGDGASKVFANFGRYHLPIASNTNIRLAGAEFFTQGWYTLGGTIDDDGSVTLGTKLGETSVFGDGSIPPVEETIDTSIKPMYQDEFILGYETEIGNDYRGSITYSYRYLGRGIEDITIDEAIGLPGEFHYILTNPGSDVTTSYDVDGDGVAEDLYLSAEALGFPKPIRKHHALNLILEKRWNKGLYVRLSYTWSHNYGNYEGMVRSDNGQDDAGITTLFDFAGLLDGAYGNLPNDRRNVIKVFSAYEFFSDWQASFAGSFQDGRPRNAFGIHPTDSFAARYGVASFFNQGVATPRGSLGRTENVVNFDFGLQYQKHINQYVLNFRIDVFNIFDSHTAIEVDEFADDGSGEASATFGLPTWFQRPRAVRFSLTYDLTL